ncbi:MAG: hypothetical protein KBB01_02435 [Candidatus Omnitrophica bacterium]|jgi:tRNA U34 2-thiouridine synthase MnmA/TrmU|nr:hypothetical protein [Candidatus Omnitrophota bacterium]
MKALALLSGGLDSTLAIKVLLEQGIEIVALNFKSPFCRCDTSKGCGSLVKRIANDLGVDFKVIYLGKEYLEMLKEPRHGYGKNLNPCIDCRILKFKKAKEVMKSIGASFIITGEVLGQRPMSQYRKALQIIDKEAEVEDLVLRPLSARLFSPILAEREGWIDREKLFDISGRSRKVQLELANSLGIHEYSCPAGGCLLTDPNFSKKVKDMLDCNDLTIENIEILKSGRYFRFNPYYWMVVARDEKESQRLYSLVGKEDFIFEPLELSGPTALGKGKLSEELKTTCCKIIGWYTSREEELKVKIKSQDKEEIINISPIREEEFSTLRI